MLGTAHTIPIVAAMFVGALTPAYAANAIPSEERPATIAETRAIPYDQALRIEYLDNGCLAVERQPPDGKGMTIPPQIVCPTFYRPPPGEGSWSSYNDFIRDLLHRKTE